MTNADIDAIKNAPNIMTFMIEEIETAFSAVYDLIPESDFDEQGEQLSDAFHGPMNRLRELLGLVR